MNPCKLLAEVFPHEQSHGWPAFHPVSPAHPATVTDRIQSIGFLDVKYNELCFHALDQSLFSFC